MAARASCRTSLARSGCEGAWGHAVWDAVSCAVGSASDGAAKCNRRHAFCYLGSTLVYFVDLSHLLFLDSKSTNRQIALEVWRFSGAHNLQRGAEPPQRPDIDVVLDAAEASIARALLQT